MCSVVDASARDQVFGDDPTPAGKLFLDWLTPKRGGKLIVGGKLLKELSGLQKFQFWLYEAQKSGVAKIKDDVILNSQISYLERRKLCTSNDTHVIALAMLGGGRILCANDGDLRNDFRNIIHGDIYDTSAPGDVTPRHYRLLRRPCPS
jgi:hypothetical protein